MSKLVNPFLVIILNFKFINLTKMYDMINICQTSGTATQELFNPRQRRQKLVKTIFHIHEKMDLFFFCKMTYLKFLCVVLITASAQVVQVIKWIFKVQISFPRGRMINQKTNYPNYSRSLLFELHC